MLQIDAWKRVLIVLTCVVGLVLALPNAFYTRVENHNDAAAAIELFGETPERAEALSGWPDFLPSGLVNLGLDLRGGAHLLAEVQGLSGNIAGLHQSRAEYFILNGILDEAERQLTYALKLTKDDYHTSAQINQRLRDVALMREQIERL